ncbi:MAG: D-alanyl-D-alanine carboxypeptidase [Sideroxydans sp.]|nr:D-alanyl-D-alanine carboxypeptidase [Sideroxydans sp.]
MPHNPFPEVATSYLVEIDGAQVWAQQPSRRLPPASLTKLMTALLVVEHGQLQAVTRVSHAAAHESGTRIGIQPGETFRIKDLLAAALIDSANDACHALADAVAGSEKNFVRQMNERAQQLGMRDTRFVNACGHDAVHHYSSTHDLALLAHELLKHGEITALTAKRGARIATLDGKHRFSFSSRNALIGRYRGVLGLKTGYTPRAGKCLVAYAVRGNTRVLLVMLHGHDRWWDAVDLLDLAFDHAHH